MDNKSQEYIDLEKVLNSITEKKYVKYLDRKDKKDVFDKIKVVQKIR